MAHELNSILKRDIECTTNSFKIINYKPIKARINLEHSLLDNQNLSKNNSSINLIKREIESDYIFNSVSNHMLVATPMNHSLKKINCKSIDTNNLMLLTTPSTISSNNQINTNPSGITISKKYFSNSSDRKILNSPSTVNPLTGTTKMGSRRIFTPQFKLQVLDSYRNDSDCKGNQRATARKYGIHRRQIQKWLQCESNLRSSVANINNQNNIKHQFHNISHSNNNNNNNKNNTNNNRTQSSAISTSVSITKSPSLLTTVIAETTLPHQHKLGLETARHQNVPLMRPIPLQHDVNNNNNTMTTNCGNSELSNNTLPSFLTQNQLNQHCNRVSNNALSNLFTTATTISATMSSGLIPSSIQSVNFRSSNDLISNNSDIPIVEMKTPQSNTAYNLPALPFSTVSTINCSNQQGRINNSITHPICNSNITYAPDSPTVSTITTSSLTTTATAAISSELSCKNDQNVPLITIPRLQTPHHHYHHQQYSAHNITHPQNYPYHYQYLHQQTISTSNTQQPQQHIAIVQASHDKNQIYMPQSISLPINSRNIISDATNSMLATAERQSILHHQIPEQNTAHSLRVHIHNSIEEKGNLTGNSIASYDYQIENREHIVATVKPKLEKESICTFSPIDLSFGNRLRSENDNQPSEELDEIQVDVCGEFENNEHLVDSKPSEIFYITDNVSNVQTNNDSVVDLSCRKRKLADNNIKKPTEKLQKLDQKLDNYKPVKLFKPYLLDDDNESDDNDTKKLNITLKNETINQNSIIWSHYQSEWDSNIDATNSNNFLRNPQQSQTNLEYPETLGSPNFQNQSLSGNISGNSHSHAIHLSDTCKSTVLSGSVLSPRSPSGFWNYPKGSPVSGYETASIYSDCSDYYNSSTNKSAAYNTKTLLSSGPTKLAQSIAAIDEPQSGSEISATLSSNHVKCNYYEESKTISFKRNHIQRWLEHDPELDNGGQDIVLFS